MAYRLKLPEGARIHDVFHVSLLKPFVAGGSVEFEGELPSDILGTRPILRPIKVLDRRVTLQGDIAVDQVLVEWAGASQSQPTWNLLLRCVADFRNSLRTRSLLTSGELIRVFPQHPQQRHQ